MRRSGIMAYIPLRQERHYTCTDMMDETETGKNARMVFGTCLDTMLRYYVSYVSPKSGLYRARHSALLERFQSEIM